MALLVRIVLAAILVAAAAAKARRLRSSASALATYGVAEPLRVPATLLLITTEAALAVGVAAGIDGAAYVAGGLLAAFAVLLAVEILRGRSGQPCGCFGAGSRVGLAAILRNVGLAAAFVAAPSIPTAAPGRLGWVVIGLAFSFACIVVLAVAVLALAREVGVLRLRLRTESALDIAEEGPPLGSRVSIPAGPGHSAAGGLTLAIFASDGCRLCRALEPVVAAFRRDPLVAVAEFDEIRDADVWRALDIPGSPYAVALDGDGHVRAKGTFNSYGQLEGILATAERNAVEAVHA